MQISHPNSCMCSTIFSLRKSGRSHLPLRQELLVASGSQSEKGNEDVEGGRRWGSTWTQRATESRFETESANSISTLLLHEQKKDFVFVYSIFYSAQSWPDYKQNFILHSQWALDFSCVWVQTEMCLENWNQILSSINVWLKICIIINNLRKEMFFLNPLSIL